MLINEITEEEMKNYADSKSSKQVAALLSQSLPNGTFKVQNPGGVKKIHHIRAQKISVAELKIAMTTLGAQAVGADSTQVLLSGKFPVYSFLLNDIIYSIVIGSVTGGNENVIGINRKQLAPTGLGLDGKKFNKRQLILATKKSLGSLRDEQLKLALSGLVDIAANGGQGALNPDLAKSISPVLGMISQDFGEILAPLLIMSDKDIAEFPSGNNPIVDVKLQNTNLSVKALTGSGTSFKTVADLMDKYEESIGSNKDLVKKYNILKQFHPKTGGKNVDKIIRACAAVPTPEYTALCSILGVTDIKDYGNLSALMTKITKKMDYAKFLKTFYPVMIAGNWIAKNRVKVLGMPADGYYYMGVKKEAPKKEKAAGKNSYDSNPSIGSSNILTYVLGIGLLEYIRNGSDNKIYSDMMTDIVKQANASIGHITINGDGSMDLKTTPFSQLRFEFQYHAPSHIPGNNLPGFMYVPS